MSVKLLSEAKSYFSSDYLCAFKSDTSIVTRYLISKEIEKVF